MKLILRDRNQEMVDAWGVEFRGLPDVEIGCGDIFDRPADAIVSPANSFGFMNGGIDAVYARRFVGIQEKLQAHLVKHHHGELPVGQAAAIQLDDPDYRFLISAPTMRVPMDIHGTVNAYLAMRAVLHLVKNLNTVHHEVIEEGSGFIKSVLCPGLGTAIGRLPYNIAARQMREAYRIVVENSPLRFDHIADSYNYHEAMRRGLIYGKQEAATAKEHDES